MASGERAGGIALPRKTCLMRPNAPGGRVMQGRSCKW